MGYNCYWKSKINWLIFKIYFARYRKNDLKLKLLKNEKINENRWKIFLSINSIDGENWKIIIETK